MNESDSSAPGKDPAISLGESAARGAIWIYGRMMSVQLIRFAAIVILARQLDIRAFGIVALANVALTLLSVLASQGVNQFIIYDRQTGFEERAKAAFWLSIVISLAAVLAGFAGAPIVAIFFDEPQLIPILGLLLLRFPFNAITRVFDAVRNKALHFRSIEIRDTTIEFGIAVTSIGMALAGYGVWSLVVPAVLLAPVQSAIAVLTARWSPGWRWRMKLWPRIFKYSANVIGSSLTSFVITHGDTLLVGRLMGSGLLGIYNLAWQTSNLASKNIVNIGSKLFFPMLVAVSDDRDRMINLLQRLLEIISAIAFPALVGLFVLADDFVHVVYGEKWSEAVLPLRILIIYAVRYSLGSPLGPTLKALGRPDIIFKHGLLTVPFYSLAVWLGSAYGIVGVASGVTIVRTVFGALLFVITSRQLDVKTMCLIRPMLSSSAAALLMGTVLIIAEAGWIAVDNAFSVTKLIVLTCVGAFTYFLNIRFIFRDTAQALAKLYTQIIGRQASVVNRVLGVEA